MTQNQIFLTEDEYIEVNELKAEHNKSHISLSNALRLYLGLMCDMNHSEAYSMFKHIYEFDRISDTSNSSIALNATTTSSISIFAGIMAANCLLLGDGVEKNHEEAYEIYKELSKQSYVALYNRGLCHEFGLKVRRNMNAAKYYYNKIEENCKISQASFALYRLGLYYFYGTGTQKDLWKAHYYFNNLAQIGHKKAMRMLAQIYENGYGVVEPDIMTALALYNKSSDTTLDTPYGYEALDEISNGVFIDIMKGKRPFDTGAQTNNILEASEDFYKQNEPIYSTYEELFRDYIQAKATSNYKKHIQILRILVNMGFVDATVELANIVTENTESDKENNFNNQTNTNYQINIQDVHEAIDATIKTAYSKYSRRSFAYLRSRLWLDEQEKPNTDLLMELYDKETLLVYEKLIENNICNDRELFEYMCICAFGINREKDEKKILQLAMQLSDEFLNEEYSIERKILFAYLACIDDKYNSSGKQNIINQQKWIQLPINDWHECHVALEICKRNIDSQQSQIFEVIKNFADKKISAYLLGLVYEKAGTDDLSLKNMAMGYFLDALKIDNSDRPFRLIARDYPEKLFEDFVVEYVRERYIPKQWGCKLGYEVGEYFWTPWYMDRAAAAYLVAAKEGINKARFAYLRTCMLSFCDFNAAIKMSKFVKSFGTIAKAAFIVYTEIYKRNDGDLDKVNEYLHQKAYGNNIAHWFISVFGNKEIRHEQIINEMKAKGGLFDIQRYTLERVSQYDEQHLQTFINLLKIYDKNSKNIRFMYYKNMFVGNGIEKNEVKAFTEIKSMAMDIKHNNVPAKLFLAEIMSDDTSSNNPYKNFEGSVSILKELANAENPDACERLAQMGERGQVNMDKDTVYRLRSAANMKRAMRKHRISQIYASKASNIVLLTICVIVMLFMFISCKSGNQGAWETTPVVDSTAAITVGDTSDATTTVPKVVEQAKEINLLIDDWLGWKPIIDANGGLVAGSDSTYRNVYNINVNIKSKPATELTIRALADALIDKEYNAIGCSINQFAIIHPILASYGITAKAIYVPAKSNGWNYLLSNDKTNALSDELSPRIASRSESNTLYLVLSYFYIVKNDVFSKVIDSLQLFDSDDEAIKAYSEGRAEWVALDKSYANVPDGWLAYDTERNPDAVIGTIVVTDSVIANNNLVDGFVKGAIDAMKQTVVAHETANQKDDSDNVNQPLVSSEAINQSPVVYDKIRQIPIYEKLSDSEMIELESNIAYVDEVSNRDILFAKNIAQNVYENQLYFSDRLNDTKYSKNEKWSAETTYYLGALPAPIPTPSPTLTPSPTPSPMPTPTPTPKPSSDTSPSPVKTLAPATPTPKPTPIPTPKPTPSPEIVRTAEIRFVGDSAEFINLQEAREALSQIIVELREMSGYSITICGYVSVKEGNVATVYGEQLARERAERVKRYFIEEGIDESRITAVGKGGIESDFAGYDERNRKVEIEYRLKN